MPDLPPELWALFGAMVAAVAAIIRERIIRASSHEKSPYESMAARLEQVERRAELVPILNARMMVLVEWSRKAAQWMEDAGESYYEATGVHLFPPAPLPPPDFDQRWFDLGPPNGTERRTR